jgi:hypothetical protein
LQTLCPQLNHIRSAVAKLLCHSFGWTAVQIRRVNKGVEFTLGEWFHREN